MSVMSQFEKEPPLTKPSESPETSFHRRELMTTFPQPAPDENVLGHQIAVNNIRGGQLPEPCLVADLFSGGIDSFGWSSVRPRASSDI